jgi:hypothetical protein
MADVPSPEEAARTILDIFVSHFKNRAGDVLGSGSFRVVLQEYGLSVKDFETGMGYAVNQGWVEWYAVAPRVNRTG